MVRGSATAFQTHFIERLLANNNFEVTADVSRSPFCQKHYLPVDFASLRSSCPGVSIPNPAPVLAPDSSNKPGRQGKGKGKGKAPPSTLENRDISRDLEEVILSFLLGGGGDAVGIDPRCRNTLG